MGGVLARIHTFSILQRLSAPQNRQVNSSVLGIASPHILSVACQPVPQTVNLFPPPSCNIVMQFVEYHHLLQHDLHVRDLLGNVLPVCLTSQAFAQLFLQFAQFLDCSNSLNLTAIGRKRRFEDFFFFHNSYPPSFRRHRRLEYSELKIPVDILFVQNLTIRIRVVDIYHFFHLRAPVLNRSAWGQVAQCGT